MLSGGKGVGLGVALRTTDGFDISLALSGDDLWTDPPACRPGVTGQAADRSLLQIATSGTKLGPEGRSPDGRRIRCSTDEGF